MNTTQKVIKIFAIALAILIIGSILNLGFFIISLTTGVNLLNDNTINFDEEYEKITSIEIDSVAASIKIVKGDIFKVEASNVNESFSVKNINNKLVIKEEKLNIFKTSNNSKITIYVPNINLNILKINSGAGQISISDIKTDNIEIDQGAGIIEITDSNLSNIKIEGGAGEMIINSSIIHNLDMDAGVGKVTIDADLMGINHIDCGIGELNLKLSDKEKYHLDITKGLGNIKVDGEIKNTDYNYGNGENIINISGGVGNISVDFN